EVGDAPLCGRGHNKHGDEARRRSGRPRDADLDVVGGERFVEGGKALVGGRGPRGRHGRGPRGVRRGGQRCDPGGGGIERRRQGRRERAVHEHVAGKSRDRGGKIRGGERALHGCGGESQPLERAEVRVLPVLIARGRQALRRERRERRAPTGGEGRWGRERTRGKHVLLGDPGGEG